jgi:NAD(P)-dependent dehydrogenase (short-subunit alcohol dehydrogenase family)
VTGAAMGLGREIAIQFAKEGSKVVLADINNELGRQVEETIVKAQGSASFVQTDVSRASEVQRMVSHTVSTFGHLDILVNNAGVVEAAAIEKLSEEAWERVIGINLKGAWLSSKYCVPHMRAQGTGVIINMSSELGLVGFPSYSAYCASKGGIIAMTRALAAELAPTIRVNCICPGAVLTPMLEREFRTSLSVDQDVGAAKEELIKRYPLGRLGIASDVASAALYLASEEASWVTGVMLPVDGGGSAI